MLIKINYNNLIMHYNMCIKNWFMNNVDKHMMRSPRYELVKSIILGRIEGKRVADTSQMVRPG